MYNKPELMLVGAASDLVLDTSPAIGQPSGNRKCSDTPDVPADTYEYVPEELW